MENIPFDELQIGQSAELRRLVTVEDLIVFANASGDHNPTHLPGYDGDGDGKPEATAPAMWLGSLISGVLGNVLPGAGTVYLKQNLEFHEIVKAGDELLARVEVRHKHDDGTVLLATSVVRSSDDVPVVTGEATIRAPLTKRVFSDIHVPGLVVRRHAQFERLIDAADDLPPVTMAVVAPEEINSLGGALLAHERGLIDPILIGDPKKIVAAADTLGKPLDGLQIVEEVDHQQAARKAVDLVRSGEARSLMKGHLHTEDLLHPVLNKEHGLRGRRRLSHVFVMDVPGMTHPLLVTDAAINIVPDLQTKADIIQNAIDVAQAIGLQEPRVGILSAVETVNPNIQSSVDAAILSKMAERGQIRGALVDGPLAMDNAVSAAAARVKGLTGPVAGHAEVLIVPNLDAGNMLAKQLIHVGGAESAGLVLGAMAPIVLTSRADDDMARLASCAIAALHEAWQARR